MEIRDALEPFLEYLSTNPNPSLEFLQRLPKSLDITHRKLLKVLKNRRVIPIELEGNQPDFNLCRVVDREVRADLADQTITKIVHKGFTLG